MLKKLLDNTKTGKFWFKLLRDLLILVIIVYLINLYQSRHIVTQAPILKEQLLSGENIELRKKLKESPVIIYFWATWCPVCRFTSNTITELNLEYQVLSIALDSGTNEQISDYLSEHNYRFPVINDSDGQISQQWGVFATPSILIIDQSGNISSSLIGVSSKLGVKWRLFFAQ